MRLLPIIQDSSVDIVRGLIPQFEARGVIVTIGDSGCDTPRGGELLNNNVPTHIHMVTNEMRR